MQSTQSAKNVMKSRARRRRRESERESEYKLEIKEDGVTEPVIWSFRNFHECHLYPKIEAEDNKPARKPDYSELEYAEKLVDKFHHFGHGKVVVVDKTNNGNIIAVAEFIPIEELSEGEKNDINFVTTFLHESKKFVDPVGPSRVWGGGMWAFGWRKAMKSFELFGVYVLEPAIRTFFPQYRNLSSRSPKVSEILGRMFHKLADIPFNNNRSIMANNKIPSLSSFRFEDELGKFDCAPHVTFTTHSFYNSPHCDNRDISTYAFALFVPTHSSDGSLAKPTDGYDVSGGRFVMPDYNFCFDLSKQKGIVKLLWAASRYKHCTLPTVESPQFTRMAMSLQINNRTANTSRDLESGEIYNRKSNRNKKREDLYVADPSYHFKKFSG